jgi:lipopolysaccharide transport system ATP-binding protein
MSDIAIRVENLGKQYYIGAQQQRYRTLRDTLTTAATAPFRSVQTKLRRMKSTESDAEDSFWALKDISFEVKHGEVIGVIGGNGAGKSTLLKILSRITEPTKGHADVYGRVGSLLEVGTGFHPELTGRENIFLNGAILGMRRAEIDRKFDEIVAFAEIEKFVDTQVKHYSSGMGLRLGFAVAAHLEPEVLIVDEVLAVGDQVFQAKCMGKMDEVAKEGRTVLFVSHNMTAVQNLCTRGIVVRKGTLVRDAPAEEAVREYLSSLALSAKDAFTNNPERRSDGRLRLTGGRVLNEFGETTEQLVAGRPAAFEFTYENLVGMSRSRMGITIYNHLGIPVTNFDMRLTNAAINDLGAEGKVVCRIPNLPFPIGQYRVVVAAFIGEQLSDKIPNALVFDVASSAFFKSSRTPPLKHCACMVEHEWSHDATRPLAQTRMDHEIISR